MKIKYKVFTYHGAFIIHLNLIFLIVIHKWLFLCYIPVHVILKAYKANRNILSKN